MTQGFGLFFSRLYDACVETPELTKFHRHLEKWSWILNNQNAIIEKKFKECNDAVAAIHGVPCDCNVFRITDYHCANVVEEHPALRVMIGDLEALVRHYSKDLMLAHGVANLPEQVEVFARHFARYDELFENGVYGPTNEDANMYRQVPSHGNLCSLKGGEEEDAVTNLMLKHIESVNEYLHGIVRWVLRKPTPTPDTPLPDYVSLNSIRRVTHCLAAVYATVLFTGTLGILNVLESEKNRIITLGCLAFVLMLSLTILVPSLKRNDLFTIAAGYFAVGGVYIGAKGVGPRQT